MTTKAAFSPEEWTELLQAPMTVAMYITIVSPSVFGSVKEAYSVARSIAQKVQGAAPMVGG
jgi:hypothetical protein